MQAPVRDFFDWRYRAHELYDNLTMYVLPNHPISLDYTQKTVFSGDSAVLGLIMGFPGDEKVQPTIKLFNTLFPNRLSASFDKSTPNKAWGRVTAMRALPVPGALRAVAVNRNNDILASTETGLAIFTASGQATIDAPATVSLIQFTPLDYAPDAFLCTENGDVLKYSANTGTITRLAEFKRPVISISVDPYKPTTALVAQGKTHVHLIDSRESASVGVKVGAHTSAVAFATEMPFMFATGSLSGNVAVYDIRMTTGAVASVDAHEGGVTSLKWCPHQRDVIGSASLDTTVKLWSIRDQETSSTTLFSHKGHVAPIIAFDWCKDMPWTLASVSEDNLLEVWTVAGGQLEEYLFGV